VWTLSDCLSHSISYTQVITVIDTQAPTISPASPATVEATCKNVPLPPDVCASDNCPGMRMQFAEVKTQLHSNPQCARYTLNRTWTALDACGNAQSTSQTVRVYDTTPPVCTHPVLPETIDCTQDLQPPAPNCTDDCSDVTLEAFPLELPGPLNCTESKILAFNWRASDACGNYIWINATVTVTVQAPPAIQGVPPVTILECTAPPPAIAPTVNDACFGALPATVALSTTPGPCAGIRNETYTFTVVNPCGLAGENVSITIQYVDNTAPEWTAALPENVTVQCDQIPEPTTLQASDNCPSDVNITFTETKVPGSCANSYQLIRKWTATDCAGHSLTHVQVITVVDTTPPVLTHDFQNVTADCNNIPLPPDVCGSQLPRRRDSLHRDPR